MRDIFSLSMKMETADGLVCLPMPLYFSGLLPE
jgi:hypothetical protein